MLLGLLTVYTLCAAVFWIVGKFADDELWTSDASAAGRVAGSLFWPLALLGVVAAAGWAALREADASAHPLPIDARPEIPIAVPMPAAAAPGALSRAPTAPHATEPVRHAAEL